MKTLLRLALLAPALALGAVPSTTPPAQEIPHLERRGKVTQLVVNGQPFLVLGGEVHNSSSSSLEYMKPVWGRLAQMGLNTALVPVSWEQFEPTEGKYDFALVDGLLADARRSRLHVMLLWMGSWKNSTSRYAADWVKADQARFPRVRNAAGKPLEIISPFSDAARDADARAYAALMRHLREVDSVQRTVLMMQLENEVGVLGDSRDRCDAANAAFNGSVPAQLFDFLGRQHLLSEKPSPKWSELTPDPEVDRAFMAWQYGRYMNAIAAAGKAEYPLPVFVNAWIIQPEDKGPGDYPSGGPVADVHRVWRAAAPAIDILAPDIYLPNFPDILAAYSQNDNPVFIPESRAGAVGVANAFYAIGQFGAIGYSPFGIDGPDTPVAGLTISGSPAVAQANPFPRAYALLGALEPLILKAQETGNIAGAWLNANTTTQNVTLGNYTLNFELRRNRRGPDANDPSVGAGLVIALGADEFLVAGLDVQVTFAPANGAPGEIAGLLVVEEGEYTEGRWKPGRRLNGDEVQLRYDLSAAAAAGQSGAGLRFTGGPTLQRVTLYRYK